MKAEGLKEARKFVSTFAVKAEGAASSALKRVGAGVATELNRKTREEYTVKAGDIKNTIRVRTVSANEVVVTSKGANLPLPKFRITPRSPSSGKRSKGVKVAVKKGGGKKIKPAFVSSLSSGHTGVFARKPGVSSPPRKRNAKGDYPQLPIDEGFGPAAPIMMNNAEVVKHVEDEALTRMITRLDHEIGRVLR